MSYPPPSKLSKHEQKSDVSIRVHINTPSMVRERSLAKPKERKEGLDECAIKILNYLQEKGTATFKEINDDLDMPYRRSSDILNVLLTTPLVTRPPKDNKIKTPYQFCDGKPISEPINVKSIVKDIEYEKKRIVELQKIIEKKKNEEIKIESGE